MRKDGPLIAVGKGVTKQNGAIVEDDVHTSAQRPDHGQNPARRRGLQKGQRRTPSLHGSKGAALSPNTGPGGSDGNGKGKGKGAGKGAGKATPATNPLYDPSAALSGPTLKGAAKSLVNAQLKPALQSLDNQQEQTARNQVYTQSRLKDFFAMLGQQQQALLGAGAAATTQGNQAQADIAGNTQSVLAKAAEAAQARLAQEAAVRGGDVMGTSADQLAARYAADAGDASARAGINQGRAAALNTANQSALAGMGLAANMRGAEMGRDVTNGFAKILGDIAQKRGDLTAQRPGLFADAVQKLRQQQFDNAVTLEGLGIRRDQIQADAATANARITETERHNQQMEDSATHDDMLADKRFQLDKKKFGYQKARERYQKAHHLGSYHVPGDKNNDGVVSAGELKTSQANGQKGGLTPTQKRARRKATTEFYAGVDEALQTKLPQVVKYLKSKGKPLTPANVRTGLNGLGVKDPLMLDVILNGGSVPPALAKKLKDAGYLVPKDKRPTPPGDVLDTILGAFGLGK